MTGMPRKNDKCKCGHAAGEHRPSCWSPRLVCAAGKCGCVEFKTRNDSGKVEP